MAFIGSAVLYFHKHSGLCGGLPLLRDVDRRLYFPFVITSRAGVYRAVTSLVDYGRHLFGWVEMFQHMQLLPIRYFDSHTLVDIM